jgi:hypothetical protein
MDAPLHTITDPYLASFLTSQKARLVSCKRTGPKTVEFRFAADRRLHDLLRLYWSGEPVWFAPSRLLDSLRALKSRSITRG